MENLLTIVQVASYLKMHPKTLYKMLRENRIALSFVRRKRSIFLRESVVKAYIEMSEVRLDGAAPSVKKPKPKPKGKVIADVPLILRKFPTFKDGIFSEEKTSESFQVLTDEQAQNFFRTYKADDSGSRAAAK